MHPSFELREFFHLVFLKNLSLRLSGRTYAVKGGICLRFFHQSPRFSEDMDFDITAQVPLHTLGKAVDQIVQSRSFLGQLIPHGITKMDVRKPKQTDTTQRWKFTLYLGPSLSLPTKIEFSKRRLDIPFIQGIPDRSLLNHYTIPPFATQYYDAGIMAVHKIVALASPSRWAVRDLFDLYHLYFNLQANPKEIKKWLHSETIEKAAEKIVEFTYKDFREQVMPYLTESLIDFYQKKNAFETLKQQVENQMLELIE
jgi:predicted nucleotidyltransferase component of viral defense system